MRRAAPRAPLFSPPALTAGVAALRRGAGAGGHRHRHAVRDHGSAVLGAGVPPRRRFLHLQPLLLPQPMKTAAPPLPRPASCSTACGGVPGNSVATVDGEPIEKREYDHWNTVVRKLSPGIKPDDARNQALQVLVSFRWVEGEAERLGVKVSDADVTKSFARAEAAGLPEGGRLPEVPQGHDADRGRHRRPRAGRPARPEDPGAGGQGQGQGLRQGDRRLLRQEQGALRAAGEAGSARRC